MSIAPRIHFIRKMNTSAKLLVMCVLFIIPIAFSVYSFVAEKNISIEFARKEEVGNRYVAAVRPLLAGILAHVRGATDTDGALGNAAAILDQARSGLGSGMDTEAQTRKLADAIAKLRGADAGAAGDAAVDAANALISRIGDDSNLTLDPDLDSFYVQDTMVGKLPTLLGQLSATLGTARAVAKSGQFGTEDRVRFLLLDGSLKSTIDGIKDNMAQAYRGNVDGHLKPAIDPRYQAAISAAEAYEAGLQKALIAQGGRGIDMSGIERLYDAAESTTVAFWQATSDELHRLLKARIDGLLGKLWLNLLISSGLALLSLGVAVAVWRNIVRPLVRLQSVADQVKKTEDYDLRVNDRGTDEVGRLAQSFDNMLAELASNRSRRAEEERRAAEEAREREEAKRAAEAAHRDEIEKRDRAAAEQRRAEMLKLADRLEASVKEIVVAVTGAGVEMRSTAEGMATTANQASKQLAAVAAASEQASANVQTVATAAEELSSSVSEISRQVNESNRIAVKAVDEVERTNGTVQSLADAAQKIGEVINLINDIASQTNLLALNATIEAARAGEAGKGFAVVAAEVKGLANQTAKATEEITAQIDEMRSATATAVGAIKNIGGTIKQVSEIAAIIAAAVEEQGAATQEIARNVQQAATGTHEVSSNVVTVTDAANSSGKAATQVLTAAESLSQQSIRLREEVDRFLGEIRAA